MGQVNIQAPSSLLSGAPDIAIVDVHGAEKWGTVTITLTVEQAGSTAGTVDPSSAEVTADSAGNARANFTFTCSKRGGVVLLARAKDAKNTFFEAGTKGVTVQ